MDLPQLSSHGPSRPLNVSIKWVQFDELSNKHTNQCNLTRTHQRMAYHGLMSWPLAQAFGASVEFGCCQVSWLREKVRFRAETWCCFHRPRLVAGDAPSTTQRLKTQSSRLSRRLKMEAQPSQLNELTTEICSSDEMYLNRTGTWTDKKSPIDFVVRWGCVAQTYQNFVYKDPQARKPKPFFRQTRMMDEVETCLHGFVDLRHLGCGCGLRRSDWLQTISAPISPVRLLAMSSKTPVKYSQHSSALMGITGNICVKAIPTTCLPKPAALQSLLSLDSSILTAVIVFISFSLGNSSSPPLTLRGTLLQKPCSKLLGPSVPRQWIVKPEVCLRSSKRSKTSNDIYHCIVFHLILILLLLPSSVAGLTLSIEFIFVRPSDDAVCIGKARGWACKNAWRVCSSRRFGTFATNEAGHVSGEFDGVRLDMRFVFQENAVQEAVEKRSVRL